MGFIRFCFTNDNQMGFIRLSFCFANDNQITPQGYFGHFNMDTLVIKSFYGGAGRGYGGGGRICPKCFKNIYFGESLFLHLHHIVVRLHIW